MRGVGRRGRLIQAALRIDAGDVADPRTGVVEDLFPANYGERGDSVSDPALLCKLADAKLAAAVDSLIAEGWSWAEVDETGRASVGLGSLPHRQPKLSKARLRLGPLAHVAELGDLASTHAPPACAPPAYRVAVKPIAPQLLALLQASEKQMQSAVSWFLHGLKKDGLIRKGCTLHGLRVTYAASIRRMGLDTGVVADALGDRSRLMGEHYTRHVEKEVSRLRAYALKNGVQNG